MANKKITIDEEIERVLGVLSSLEPQCDEYATVSRNLKELYEARSKKADHIVDFNVIATILGGIAQIVVIMNYEQLHVFSTKALGWVLRGRMM